MKVSVPYLEIIKVDGRIEGDQAELGARVPWKVVKALLDCLNGLTGWEGERSGRHVWDRPGAWREVWEEAMRREYNTAKMKR